MKVNSLTCAALIVLSLLTSSVAWGEPFGRGRLFARWPYYREPVPYFTRSPNRPYPRAEEWYPQYYGGFHYRHLDNLGIPSGDIGIRGNGISMSPW